MNTRTEPTILHVDLDAFFASVETLDDPTLRGRPVIVGGTGARGVVATANYEARRYGVHSAMPTSHARARCPSGVFLAPRFDAYRDYSERVMRVLREVTPLVEPLSLDEAFLDVAGVLRRQREPAEIGASIRDRIVEVTGGLTASVGAATTKLIAKIASDLAKPDGMLVVAAEDSVEFLQALPIERMWGVGPATKRRLERLGIRTIGDLALVDERVLVQAVGTAHGHRLRALARNVDDRAVVSEREPKSVGAEETFEHDVFERPALERALRELARRVGGRLRADDLSARVVTLKLRYPDFATVTRSHTADPTDRGSEIAARATALLDRLDLTPGVRLIGISVHRLQHGAQGVLDLDGSRPERRDALEVAADEVRRRFGARSLGSARRMTADES